MDMSTHFASSFTAGPNTSKILNCDFLFYLRLICDKYEDCLLLWSAPKKWPMSLATKAEAAIGPLLYPLSQSSCTVFQCSSASSSRLATLVYRGTLPAN